jgi:hypothetical protein
MLILCVVERLVHAFASPARVHVGRVRESNSDVPATKRKEPLMRVHGSRIPLLAFLAGSTLLLFHVPSANAIPAFARMHQTSCKDVPDGTYTLKVWHPTLKPAQKSVVVKGATEVNFAIAK